MVEVISLHLDKTVVNKMSKSLCPRAVDVNVAVVDKPCFSFDIVCDKPSSVLEAEWGRDDDLRNKIKDIKVQLQVLLHTVSVGNDHDHNQQAMAVIRVTQLWSEAPSRMSDDHGPVLIGHDSAHIKNGNTSTFFKLYPRCDC